MSESFDDPSLTKFHHFSRQIPHILEDEVIPAPLRRLVKIILDQT